VLLISIDTLRADRLGCYGYAKPTTPALDAFSKDAILFRQAFSQAPSTLPSHASIFTSLLPGQHGALLSKRSSLSPSFITIAEALKQAGYTTAAYHGGGQMNERFGLAQGFDTYAEIEGPFGDTVRAAMDWLGALRQERFFLFLHTYAVHHPYTPSEDSLRLFETDYDGPLPREVRIDLLRQINSRALEVSPRDLAHVSSTYDAEIRETDDALGSLLAFLKREQLYDSTAIVFTSDHGEEMGEHGRVGWHSHTLYDELLHVPLLIKLPGSKLGGSVVDDVVRSIDIAPTLLGILGLPPVTAFAGTDLSRFFGRRIDPKLTVVSQRDGKRESLATAVRTERWKLNGARLFDLESDPREQQAVPMGSHPEVRRALQATVEAIGSSRPRGAPNVELDERTRAQLRALGYIADEP
jgi:arylsulfatase A-like enzyme